MVSGNNENETSLGVETPFFNWQFINDARNVGGEISVRKMVKWVFKSSLCSVETFQGKQQYFSHVLSSLFFSPNPARKRIIPPFGRIPFFMDTGKLGISSSLILLFLSPSVISEGVATGLAQNTHLLPKVCAYFSRKIPRWNRGVVHWKSRQLSQPLCSSRRELATS